MEKWKGKVAIVTGASAGVGEAIVRDLAKNGIHVVGLARRSEKVEAFAETLGDTPGKIYAVKCDVSDQQSIKDAFKWIEQKFHTISILVNNAAIIYNGTIIGEGEGDITEELNAVMNTNFTGPVHCTREAIRLIKKSDDYGMIININSIAGNYVPFMCGNNLYAPSKHALRAFSEVLRQELVIAKNSKIRVTNLSPGVVKTDMVVASGLVAEKDKEKVYENLAHLNSEDVSESVLFLLQIPYHVNITQLTIQPVGEKV